MTFFGIKLGIFLGVLVFALTGCDKTRLGGSSGKKEADIQQKSDRPSEQGAGLPGYSIFCGINGSQAAEDKVDVGCKLVDEKGNRRPGYQDTWTRYKVEVRNPPPELKIEKETTTISGIWDVHFIFSGLPRDRLIEIVRASNYTYEEPAADGSTIKIESNPTTQASSDIGADSNSNASLLITDCSIGSQVEGAEYQSVCFFQTSSSCNNACQTFGLTSHIKLSALVGSGAKDAGEACRLIYGKLNGYSDAPFKIEQSRGLGCYQSNGQIVFDQTPTNDQLSPPNGGTRLCACE